VRFIAFAFAFFHLTITAANAAPFILCDIPKLDTFVSFDLGNEFFQFEEEGWQIAKIDHSEHGLIARWFNQNTYIGITINTDTDRAIYIWKGPGMDMPDTGPAACKFFTKE
jgi:hypothetical protein